jgi:hypothetical protein
MSNLMNEEEVSKRLSVSLASLRRWRLLRKGPFSSRSARSFATDPKISTHGWHRCQLEEVFSARSVRVSGMIRPVEMPLTYPVIYVMWNLSSKSRV